MGSGSSKDTAPAAEAPSSSYSSSSSSSSSSSTSLSRKARLVRVFNSSSCFGLSSSSSLSAINLSRVEEDEELKDTTVVSKSRVGSSECGDVAAGAHCNQIRHSQICLNPSSHDNQITEEHSSTIPKDVGSSSSVSSSTVRSSSSSGRFHSRFSFIPDGISFRLNRTVSLGSSRARPLVASAPSVTNSGSGISPAINLDNSSNNPNGTPDNVNREIIFQDVVGACAGAGATVGQYPIRSLLESNATAVRPSNRRIGPQEPLEGSIRFSRTLSVGRLRDRVLRRTALSDGLFGPTFLEDGSFGHYGQGGGRRMLNNVRRTSSRRNNEVMLDSSASLPARTSGSLEINDVPSTDAPHRRERDLMEHRSAFLERRRRIRSQVRALQRLGSRFESLSGHDRSCILSGRHRTDRCTCRPNNRVSNPADDSSTRASISRIVMLAEALFEVLDEIHQQSVVLSSRPSFSSIGSVPAPKEVVECIPVKMYTKPSKLENEDDAQCYICLVEYEEGDCMRILPCKHEFHRSCVDKWLKEIHRVCPLCRGDVCSLDASGKSSA